MRLYLLVLFNQYLMIKMTLHTKKQVIELIPEENVCPSVIA
jgi:hypothetical protein